MTIAKLFRNHFTLAFRAGGAVPASLLGAAIIISVLTGCGSGPSGPSGDGGDAAGADSSKAARGPLPSGADSPGSPPGSAPAPPETEEPLEVLQFLPSGEIDVFTQAAVMFSRPMAVIGELDKADQSLIAVEPPIPGKVVWINEYVLGFVPDRPVTGSLEVTVRLSPEVRSLSGAAVAGGPTETEFTLPALAVERRRTAGRGAGGDPLRPQVEITFNQPVDALEFNGKSRFFWESSDGKGSAGAVWTSAGYGDGGIFGGERTFTATAEEGLPRDAAWSLTVGKGAPLASGLSELSEDFLAASGRTYGRPGILATGFGKPDDGLGGAGDGGERGPEQVMGRPEYGHLLVRFDTPIEMGEAAPFITIDPPHPEFTKLNRARSGGGCGKGAASPCAGSDPAPSGSPSPSDADPPSSPDADPSAFPDADPSVFPDADPSPVPESDPSAFPDTDPSAFPEADPSAFPEADPSAFPEADPSAFPEAVPSAFPEAVPSAFPEADPPERQDAGVPSGDEAAASDSPSGVSPSPEAECAGGSDVRTKLSVWRYAPNTDYVLTFRKGMPDVYGQKLDSDRVVRFRTGPFDPQAMLGTRGGIMESSFPPVVPVRVRNMNAIPAFGKVMADAEAARFLEMWPYAIWNGPIGWKPDAAAEWLDAASRPGPGNYSMTLVPERDSTRYVSAAGLDLGALLEGREKDGLIFAGAGGRHSYALFQVTDLAVTAKIGAAGSLAWVTRMSDGSGVEGAGVTVLDCMGRSLWSGVTGAGGTAALPGAEALGRELSPECGKSPPAVHVSASKGGERVFWSLGWSRDLDPRNMGAAGYREPFADDSLEAFLVTSQPVYRPGETAGMKAVVRRVGADGLATPGPGRVKLTVTDPAGAAAYEGFAEMSDYGTVALEWPVPEDAPAGNFRVEIDLGPPGGWESEGSGDAQGPAVPASGSGRSGSGPGPAPAVSGPARSGAGPGEYARGPRRASGTFRVAWHRAPAFGLTLGAVADALFGDGVIFRAKGEYYHGAPLGGAFRFELRHSPDWGHRPPGYGPEWSFTAREALMTEGGGWDYDPSPPGTAADGEAAAGPDGTAVFAAAIPSGGAPVPLRCELVVTASDLDGREVSRSESFTARPASLAAGLKTDGWMAFEGKPFGVALAVAGPDGRAVPGRSVRIRLMRRVWSAAGRLMLGGRFARTSDAFDELVSERTVESSSVPVRFEVTPRDAGEHYVAAELRDPEGRRAVASTGFWVPGDRVPWRAPEDGRVALAADAGTYAPGDTARILIQSPSVGGTGLLTVERGGVREARVLDLSSGSPAVEIPLSEDDVPGVWVSVALARGRAAPPPDGGDDPGRPSFRMGYLHLPVVSGKDALGVAVTADAEITSPGAPVRVEAAVTGPDGEPFGDCEVALAAVDAGLVDAYGDEAFRPEALLARRMPLRVMTGASLASTLSRAGWSKGGEGEPPVSGPAGGGGGGRPDGGPAVREDFRPLAFFAPALIPDGKGRVSAEFRLPDGLGAYRIFAVATGRGRMAGTGEARVTATRDLAVRSSLPEHLTDGDEFMASAVVQSLAGVPGELTVRIRPLEGMDLLEDGTRTLTVWPGQSVRVSFRARAVLARPAGAAAPRGAGGVLRAGFEGSLGGSEDSAVFTVPVGPAGRETADAVLALAGPGTPLPEIRLPEGADPSRGGLELLISAGPAGMLAAPLAALESSAPDSLEQSVSLATLDLYSLRLDPGSGGPGVGRLNGRRDRVEAALRLLESRLEDGGLPGRTDGGRAGRSPVLTAWALDFVREAADDGFGGASRLRDRMAGFLEEELFSRRLSPATGTVAARLYVLGALFRAGIRREGELETLLGREDVMGPAGRLLLLRAAAALPASPAGNALKAALLERAASDVELSGATARVRDPEGPVRAPWRGAGWRERSGLWLTGAGEMTALAALAFSEADPGNPLLPQLLMGALSPGGGGWGANRTAAAARAVWNWTRHARAGGGADREGEEPELAVRVFLGGHDVLAGRLGGRLAPPLRAFIPSVDLLGSPPPGWEISGTGRAWTLRRLSWAPASPDLSAASARGMALARSFRRVRPEPGPAGASAFRRGDLVSVTLTLMTSVPRAGLALEDPVPAGLEPVDFALRTVDPGLPGHTGDDPIVGLRSGWPGRWFDRAEIRPGSVRLFAETLEPGVYVYSYLARAVTPGTYVLPGPYAEETYSPENRGRGAGLTLTVGEGGTSGRNAPPGEPGRQGGRDGGRPGSDVAGVPGTGSGGPGRGAVVLTSRGRPGAARAPRTGSGTRKGNNFPVRPGAGRLPRRPAFHAGRGAFRGIPRGTGHSGSAEELSGIQVTPRAPPAVRKAVVRR